MLKRFFCDLFKKSLKSERFGDYCYCHSICPPNSSLGWSEIFLLVAAIRAKQVEHLPLNTAGIFGLLFHVIRM